VDAGPCRPTQVDRHSVPGRNSECGHGLSSQMFAGFPLQNIFGGQFRQSENNARVAEDGFRPQGIRAFCRVVKSSELIFTLTWTVRFYVLGPTSVLLFWGKEVCGLPHDGSTFAPASLCSGSQSGVGESERRWPTCRDRANLQRHRARYLPRTTTAAVRMMRKNRCEPGSGCFSISLVEAGVAQ